MVVTEEEEATIEEVVTITEVDTIIEEVKIEEDIEGEIEKVATKVEIEKEDIEVVIKEATIEMTEKVVMTLIVVASQVITKGREKLDQAHLSNLNQIQKPILTNKCKVMALNWSKADLRKLRQGE